jgi:hypothetical protein
MLELPMAASCGHQLPTIIVKQPKDVAYFHAG